MLTPTTGVPLNRANVRGSAIESVDRPRSSEPHLASGRQCNPRGREIGKRLGSGKGADRLIASADLGTPAGEIDVAAAKLPADIERGQSDPLQPHRIESHPNLALDAADALDGCRRRGFLAARGSTTSSTNNESCSGVFPGAIAA